MHEKEYHMILQISDQDLSPDDNELLFEGVMEEYGHQNEHHEKKGRIMIAARSPPDFQILRFRSCKKIMFSPVPPSTVGTISQF